MIDKIINKKITWIILSLIIVILIIILIIPKRDEEIVYIDKETEEQYKDEIEENILFELIGDEEIIVYQEDEYQELGVLALLNDETNLIDNVLIESNVDTTIVGEYKVIYTLTYKGIEKKLERKVIVIEKEESIIDLRLNGEEIIYLNINEEYNELGATASLNDKDLTNEIIIEGNVDTKKEGEYSILYKIDDRELERKVIVFNIDKLFNVDKDNLVVNITLNDNFSYIRLPNGVISKNEVVSYKILGSGNYLFTVYTKELKKYEKLITIKNEDIVSPDPPTGTCIAVLKDSKTTITVNSKSDISKYYYNGIESNSSIYTALKYLREVNVKLVGKNKKETEIKCEVKLETLPKTEVKSGTKIKYKAESESLKVTIAYDKGMYLSYVWAVDPVKQLNKYYGDTYPANILQNAVTKNNLKSKIVLGFNASPPVNSTYYKSWNSDSNYKHREPIPLMLYNGKVLVNDPNKSISLFMYYLDGSNQLKYIPKINSLTVEKRKELYQEIIDSGARNTIVWRPVLVENYKAVTLDASFLKQEAAAQRKQAICQIDANNFIVVTSENSKAGLITYPNFQKYLVGLGCKIALEFDAGGSTSLIWKPVNTNTVKKVTGGGRSLTSVLYFTELDSN